MGVKKLDIVCYGMEKMRSIWPQQNCLQTICKKKEEKKVDHLLSIATAEFRKFPIQKFVIYNVICWSEVDKKKREHSLAQQ